MTKVLSSSLKSKLSCLSDSDRLYVGLDVHKNSISASFLVNDTIVKTCMIASDPQGVVQLLAPWHSNLVRVVYEAGPTGFSLARALAEASLPVTVVTASKLARVPGRGPKSDRLDSGNLAELAAGSRPLPAVSIPTRQQEADRQLVRQRERIKHKRRRVMQQIKSFLLQHGVAEPKSCWSRAGIGQLRSLQLLAPLRTVLDCLLDELAFYSDKLTFFDKGLDELSEQQHYRHQVELCRSHPGVGRTLPPYLLTELFCLGQVRCSKQLVSYCGLAPVVRRTADHITRGPLNKSGKSSVRALLVQCAWVWVRCDSVGKLLYNRYRASTGNGAKAIVAVARKMLINLWTMVRKNRSYDGSAVCNAA